MRLVIIAGLTSVGLILGCGGVEAEPRQDVAQQALPPCEQSCLNAYKLCLKNNPPEFHYICEESESACYYNCPGGHVAPEKEALAFP
ncbi:hypothetical protein [Pyxidicoccus caerfyrddinensis]|uniref:hypothetical protein n=1 Tax=Pyxidicoccus caerfyrddinensis TaxID=2709663 RepID=UPI0013DB5A50|nr:hypothetical protein [Pyxidicoccus caerfyrddinensis]